RASGATWGSSRPRKSAPLPRIGTFPAEWVRRRPGSTSCRPPPSSRPRSRARSPTRGSSCRGPYEGRHRGACLDARPGCRHRPAHLGQVSHHHRPGGTQEARLRDRAARVRPGSPSRRHAPQAMRAIGVGAVVADSFARIFYRNAINLGIPTIEAGGVRAIFEKGDTARIEMTAGRVTNLRTGASVSFPPLPHHLLDLLEAGGLVEKVRRELKARAVAGS